MIANLKKNPIHPDRYEYLLEHYKKGKILDIGNIGGVFGAGISNSFHLRFKSCLDQESELFGLDIYDPPSDVAHLFENQYKADAEEKLPFEEDFFDTVYAGQILEHIANPNNFLLEINRVLKQDGVFILDIPNPYSIERILKWIFKREENLGDPTHLIFYTPASLKAILKYSGFEVLELCTDYKQRIPIPDFLRPGLGSHLICTSVKAIKG